MLLSRNFYGLPTRTWRLVLGAIAAILLYCGASILASRNAPSGRLSSGGSVMLSLFAPFPEDLHVTLTTLVSLITATLLVTFASNSNFSCRILSMRVFVRIGLISCSAYLFHQPLIAFTRIYIAVESNILFAIPMILTLLCASVLHRYVESPFRDRRRVPSKAALTLLTVVIFWISASGLTAHFAFDFPRGIEEKFAGHSKNVEISIAAYKQHAYAFESDDFPRWNGPNALMLGSSFGCHIVNVTLERTKFISGALNSAIFFNAKTGYFH